MEYEIYIDELKKKISDLEANNLAKESVKDEELHEKLENYKKIVDINQKKVLN